jgi:hypothetical protein
LSGSAAGFLTPEEERLLREHVAECSGCAARLEEMAILAAGLRNLPSPLPSATLAARTNALLAAGISARADRRQAAVLASAAALCGWTILLAGLYTWDLVGGQWWWAAWWVALSFAVVPAAAAVRNRRLERRLG